MSVEAGNSSISGCVIRSISATGAVGKDGRLAVGDHVVTVNNETLRRVTNAQARAIIYRTSLLSLDVRWALANQIVPLPSRDYLRSFLHASQQ